MTEPVRRRLTLALAALFSALTLGALFWHVRPGPVLAALGRLDPAVLAGMAAVTVLSEAVQPAELYRWALRAVGVTLSFRRCLLAIVGWGAVRAATPMAVGALAWSAFVHRAYGVGLARAVAAMTFIPWIKVGLLLLASLCGWAILAGPPPLLGPGLGVALALYLVASALVWRLGAGLLRWLRARDSRPRPVLDAVVATAHAVRPGAMLVTTLHCAVNLGLEGSIFALALQGLGYPAQAPLLLAYFPLILFGGKLPVSLMGFGTREARVVFLLAPMAPKEVLLSASLVYATMAYVLPGILGALLSWPFVSRVLRGGGGGPPGPGPA